MWIRWQHYWRSSLFGYEHFPAAVKDIVFVLAHFAVFEANLICISTIVSGIFVVFRLHPVSWNYCSVSDFFLSLIAKEVKTIFGFSGVGYIKNNILKFLNKWKWIFRNIFVAFSISQHRSPLNFLRFFWRMRDKRN